MRAVTMNIQHGLTEDGAVGDLRAVGREVAALDPDLVAVQEVDYRQGRSGFVDQTAELAAGLGWGSESTLFAAHFSGSARGLRLPSLSRPARTPLARAAHAVLGAGGPAVGGYGVALFSRHPITRVLRQRLGAAPARLARTTSGPIPGLNYTVRIGQSRTLLAAEVDVEGTAWRIGCAHLELGQETASAQLFHAWRLLNTGIPGPAILAGDMNLAAPTVRQVSGTGQDTDASAPTFPATDPTATIDHILVGGPARVAGVETVRLSVGDHLALVADIDPT